MRAGSAARRSRGRATAWRSVRRDGGAATVWLVQYDPRVAGGPDPRRARMAGARWSIATSSDRWPRSATWTGVPRRASRCRRQPGLQDRDPRPARQGRADRRGGADLASRISRWRPDRESNPGARICSPLRHHSAIGPRCGKARGFAQGIGAKSTIAPAIHGNLDQSPLGVGATAPYRGRAARKCVA